MNVREVSVASSSGSYPVVVAHEGLSGFPDRVRTALNDAPCYVISDRRVGRLYAAGLAEKLKAPLLQLPEGESMKTVSTLAEVAEWLAGQGLERGHGVVAVGGGVVTDIAGLAASVILRGVPWVAVPTTLLAMVDAAIGGKTGVDLTAGKNLVGSFWAPKAVLVDPAVLVTLEPRQLRSGLMEVVKAALISPFHLESTIDRSLEKLANGSLEDAAELVVQAVRAKADVVSADEREEGTRAALNLGHSLGHALEAATDYRLFLHGEAVGWGLLAALRLARDRGLLSTEEAMRWAGRLQILAPLPPVSLIHWEALRPFLSRDKKRSGGANRWVLPRPGGVALGISVPDSEVAEVYGDLQALTASGQFTSLF